MARNGKVKIFKEKKENWLLRSYIIIYEYFFIQSNLFFLFLVFDQINDEIFEFS